MKVIIIGSGIAGLTLAIACQRHGIEVVIYEKAKQLQNIGGGILLWPHGLRYLDWLGLSDNIKPYDIKIDGIDLISDEGEKIYSENYDELYSLIGGSILPIDRSAFQQSLLKQLDTQSLFLAKKCINVCSDNNKATAYFSDGTEDAADIIVGADGLYSTVRQSINREAAHQYSHFCWFGGIADHESSSFLSNKTYMAMGINKLFIAWPTVHQRMMWYLPVKMPLEHYSQEKEFHQLNDYCNDWLPEIKQMVFSSSNKQRFYLPINILSSQKISHQHIVLIGDAAHTLGPILGQGASQAIEDAYFLFHYLKNLQHQQDNAFLAYEKMRLQHYQQLARLENATSSAMVYDKKEDLHAFQNQVGNLSLVEMYQELIPLVAESYVKTMLQEMELIL